MLPSTSVYSNEPTHAMADQTVDFVSSRLHLAPRTRGQMIRGRNHDGTGTRESGRDGMERGQRDEGVHAQLRKQTIRTGESEREEEIHSRSTRHNLLRVQATKSCMHAAGHACELGFFPNDMSTTSGTLYTLARTNNQNIVPRRHPRK